MLCPLLKEMNMNASCSKLTILKPGNKMFNLNTITHTHLSKSSSNAQLLS